MNDCEANETPNKGNDKKHWWRINKDYVPLKLMYFFFLAGQACSSPYRSIFMRHLGLSAKQAGLIWTIERVLSVLTPYLIGGLTDKTRKPKAVLLTLIMSGAILGSAMYFIPQEEYVGSGLGRPVSLEEISSGKSSFCGKLKCNSSAQSCFLSDPQSSKKSCHSDVTDITAFLSNITPIHYRNRTSSDHDDVRNVTEAPTTTLSVSLRFLESFIKTNQTPSVEHIDTNHSVPWGLEGEFYFVNDDSSNAISICYQSDDTKSPDDCDILIPNQIDEYGMTFWLVTTLVLLSSLAGIGVHPVLEATSLKMLGKKNRHKFGQQRLWASIGFGTAALVVGFLKDKSTTEIGALSSGNKSFLPMFVGVFVCWTCAAIVTGKLPVKSEKKATKVRLSDIKIILKKPKVVAFYGILLFYGMCNSTIQIYLFWLAEVKLNSPSFVFGVGTFIGAFLDVPFCLSSGYLIRRFGHTPLLCFGMIVLAIRVGSAAFIVNYWQLLAVGALRGISWGLTWVVICSYTAKISPKGLENSTMGITQSFCRGIAFSLGALLGGVIFEAKGGDFLFTLCGSTTLVATGIFALLNFCIRNNDDQRKTKHQGGAKTLIGLEKGSY